VRLEPLASHHDEPDAVVVRRETIELAFIAAEPFAISVLTISGGSIVEIVAFHDAALFPDFELPPALGPSR
jgi:hypothetical protein